MARKKPVKPVSRQRRWQLAQIKAGFCPFCPAPSEEGYDSGLCEFHRLKNNEAHRRRRWLKVEAQAASSSP